MKESPLGPSAEQLNTCKYLYEDLLSCAYLYKSSGHQKF